MSAETEKNQPPADPMEVWERWYESVFQGWSKSINGKGSQARPALPNFYQLWLQSLARTQEHFSKSAGDPQELWKQWLENRHNLYSWPQLRSATAATCLKWTAGLVDRR